MILLTFVISLCLARVQYVITKFNQNSRFNGRGVILAVLNKTADSPMVYRPLAAWVLRTKTQYYQVFMVALIWLALYSVYLAWGQTVMLITCVLIAATYWYDYFDCYPELIGFSLALVSFPLALLGVAIHGLSRETAFMVGVVYGLHSGDWTGAAILTVTGFAILWLVRLVQGYHPLYCDRWMWRKNWIMLKQNNIAAWISVMFSGLSMAGAWTRIDGLIVSVIIGAGWTMAKADETRVFIAVLPYAAYFLERML